MVKKYGQTVLVTQDLALENYLDRSGASVLLFAVPIFINQAGFLNKSKVYVLSPLNLGGITLTKNCRMASHSVGDAARVCDHLKGHSNAIRTMDL